MNEKITELVDEYKRIRMLSISLVKSLIFKAIILLIDALVIWLVYVGVLVPRFNVPVLSKWEILVILFAYKFSIKGK